jgi:3-deoxy-D-manno-octulosonate 8-phosphate phosphatase (KDO 8-P phosphatase)
MKLSAALVFDEALLQRARGIKACLFDVDGVLTDGSLFISEAGETLKQFHALDGHGLKLLAQAGITPVVITGRDSPAVRRRLHDLGIQHAFFGVHDKLLAAQTVLTQLQLDWTQLAAMGDDWPDLPLLTRVAFACAPRNAHAEVRAVAHHITSLVGGHGAARECCDLLLQAAGQYQALLQGHLTTLDMAKQVAGPTA